MAFKGPSVSHRTTRSRALEIGTVASGFETDMNFADDAANAGHPSMKGAPVTLYEEQKPEVQGSAAPVAGMKPPFVLGGK